MAEARVNPNGKLKGRVALVTGASRGIGRAIAIGLARVGCNVAINFREHEGDASETARLVEAAGGRSWLARGDVADPEQVAAMVDAVNLGLGPIDILVNNAGQSQPVPLDTLTLAEFDHAIAVNLRSAFLVTQAVLSGMRARRWGRLVFVSSVAAQLGGVVGPHYAASKAGLHGLAHAYAALLAREGITANVIAPALIDTDMVRDNPLASPALIPVGRFGESSEVADAVVMVAGNGYVTGQTINVNGGWYMS
jgi:3-oxoacyl-[acyl-carrier protein] reductase